MRVAVRTAPPRRDAGKKGAGPRQRPRHQSLASGEVLSRCMVSPAPRSRLVPAMEGVRWAFSCGTWLPSRAEWLLAVRSIQPEEKERIGQFVFARDAKAAMVLLGSGARRALCVSGRAGGRAARPAGSVSAGHAGAPPRDPAPARTGPGTPRREAGVAGGGPGRPSRPGEAGPAGGRRSGFPPRLRRSGNAVVNEVLLVVRPFQATKGMLGFRITSAAGCSLKSPLVIVASKTAIARKCPG